MHFLAMYAAENGKPSSRINDAALARSPAYAWPGNVRELENVIERAVVLAQGDAIEPAHLPPRASSVSACATGAPPIPGASMDEIERYAILTTLEATGGSTSKAAEMLGISVRKIQYKLQEYGAAPKSHIPAIEGGNGHGSDAEDEDGRE